MKITKEQLREIIKEEALRIRKIEMLKEEAAKIKSELHKMEAEEIEGIVKEDELEGLVKEDELEGLIKEGNVLLGLTDPTVIALFSSVPAIVTAILGTMRLKQALMNTKKMSPEQAEKIVNNEKLMADAKKIQQIAK